MRAFSSYAETSERVAECPPTAAARAKTGIPE
jgi:hypothetical protein